MSEPSVPRGWYVKALRRIRTLEKRLRQVSPEDPELSPGRLWGDQVNTSWDRAHDHECDTDGDAQG